KQQGKLAIKKSQIETDTGRLTFFPKKVAINRLGIQVSCFAVVAGLQSVASLHLIAAQSGNVTVFYITHTWLEGADVARQCRVLEKVFTMQIPSGRYSREKTGTIVRCQA